MATKTNRRNTAIKEAITKTPILDALSKSAGHGRRDVAAVLGELGSVIERHVRRRAVGTFMLPAS